MQDFVKYAAFIGQGIGLTLQLLIGGLFFGILLGMLMSILRYKSIGVFIINKWISLLRGTPMILQLSFIYFSTSGLFGGQLTVFTAGLITFSLNSSAYIAEIFRAGIEYLPKGQFEAAQTLNISPFYTWKDIILPQVIKNILPAMINESIALLKDTALIGTISGMDIMRHAQVLGAEQFTYFLPLCIAGMYYYLLVLLIEKFGLWLAKRYEYA